jgi:hypothetical protein
LPIFEYCDIVWGDRGNVILMSELQALHNTAARIILDLPHQASASEALQKLSWKKLDRRRAEHRAIFMYKRHNNLKIKKKKIPSRKYSDLYGEIIYSNGHISAAF